ncbi:anti-sigma factor (TIGR02949 family) [Arthrobacter sp. CAN_A212]|uniref:Mycothiol system anti-sigma-R factor n=1 Tax=Arthrobacter flavus TaxID=95172 RepID=A0ABW4QA84_9MICC|nr:MULTISPECIES: mycothiol system anti-sigma-R factor [unclassified Arthrobacter]MBE0008621.1 mycothiol system anti-sigma-R factor [Arthrobacter sp. AET 35A]MBP2216107.1 anti-sigma factor (TIGR02949 family) [Arthrobacter sp. CAN_C5]NOJ58609.1 mycothiol system anti-sigma-R factor [Arthrobacter sp. 260]NOJ62454.1 mycothiol system anti-sigma-R factor [Arthrobacter sp. 147(2020)]PVE18526.1 mycothiol system anti-sigma-R factor [Arthrobacter sp. Bz4]
MSDCQSLGDCADSRIERLYDYLDGALSHDDLVEIKNHLEDCPECAEEHDLECVIRSVVKRSCTEVAPTTLKTSILDRISQIKTAEH